MPTTLRISSIIVLQNFALQEGGGEGSMQPLLFMGLQDCFPLTVLSCLVINMVPISLLVNLVFAL